MQDAQDVPSKAPFDIMALTENVKVWAENAFEQLNSVTTLYQFAAVLAAGLLGFLLSRKPSHRLRAKATARGSRDVIARLEQSLAAVLWPLFSVVLIWVATAVFGGMGIPNGLLRIAASLLNAAIVVRLVTTNMQPGPGRTLLAWIAWGLAALYILRALKPVTKALESAAVTMGDTRISALQVITSIVVAGMALWIGRFAGDAAQSQLKDSPRLTPSMAGLLGQVAKIGLMVLALVIAFTKCKMRRLYITD